MWWLMLVHGMLKHREASMDLPYVNIGECEGLGAKHLSWRIVTLVFT
jgi:hypothetical protein